MTPSALVRQIFGNLDLFAIEIQIIPAEKSVPTPIQPIDRVVPFPCPSRRRFPPPWTIDEANAACFIVRDSTGQALGYFYFEEEPGRRSAAKVLTRDQVRHMAANIAKLPEPLRKLSV